MNNKLGYIQIDLAFTLLIFILFFFVFHNISLNNINSKNSIYEFNDLKYISHTLCNLLISNSGLPINWENSFENTTTFGFKSQINNSLDYNKFNLFNNSNYGVILNKLNLEFYSLGINIRGLQTNTSYLDFGFNQTDINAPVFIISNCYSNYNLEQVKVEVTIFK